LVSEIRLDAAIFALPSEIKLTPNSDESPGPKLFEKSEERENVFADALGGIGPGRPADASKPDESRTGEPTSGPVSEIPVDTTISSLCGSLKLPPKSEELRNPNLAENSDDRQNRFPDESIPGVPKKSERRKREENVWTEDTEMSSVFEISCDARIPSVPP
jgi:hypothetical protein